VYIIFYYRNAKVKRFSLPFSRISLYLSNIATCPFAGQNCPFRVRNLMQIRSEGRGLTRAQRNPSLSRGTDTRDCCELITKIKRPERLPTILRRARCTHRGETAYTVLSKDDSGIIRRVDRTTMREFSPSERSSHPRMYITVSGELPRTARLSSPSKCLRVFSLRAEIKDILRIYRGHLPVFHECSRVPLQDRLYTLRIFREIYSKQ